MNIDFFFQLIDLFFLINSVWFFFFEIILIFFVYRVDLTDLFYVFFFKNHQTCVFLSKNHQMYFHFFQKSSIVRFFFFENHWLRILFFSKKSKIWFVVSIVKRNCVLFIMWTISFDVFHQINLLSTAHCT